MYNAWVGPLEVGACYLAFRFGDLWQTASKRILLPYTSLSSEWFSYHIYCKHYRHAGIDHLATAFKSPDLLIASILIATPKLFEFEFQAWKTMGKSRPCGSPGGFQVNIAFKSKLWTSWARAKLQNWASPTTPEDHQQVFVRKIRAFYVRVCQSHSSEKILFISVFIFYIIICSYFSEA